ncbi:hypothetical protein MTR72_24110 [Bradyrhizobium sp. ISRA442]|uniref:hypothetical protein n=1 Tax=Bradyrhizobium sp. ISRA442 TaxID=2866197 RepID=UPI00311B2243
MRRELQHLIKSWSFDIPFERSVRSNFQALQQLEASGLTWGTIANALTRAGARHKNGRPISARQMNSVFLRVRKAYLTNTANAASFGLAPPARAVEHNGEYLSDPKQAKSGGETVTITPAAMATPAPSMATGLAQRLAEAHRLREVSRTEYDD